MNLISPTLFEKIQFRLGLPDATLQHFRQAAAHIAGDSALYAQFQAQHEQIFGETYAYQITEVDAGEATSCWAPLLLLCRLPVLEAKYQALGIPDAVLTKTLSNFVFFMNNYFNVEGKIGFATYMINWLRHHMRMELFQLGRLQFERLPSPITAVVLQNAEGRTVALAPNGTLYRADGQINGTCGVSEKSPFLAEFQETDVAFYGTVLAGSGPISHEKQVFSKKIWKKLLDSDTPVLGVHIPGVGGRLTPEACDDSFAQAAAFFPKYFPNDCARAYTCVSWLLSTSVSRLLGPEANIARYAARFCLVPNLSQVSDVENYIFGGKPPPRQDDAPEHDELTLENTPLPPPQNALQQAAAEHLKKGGHFYVAGGYIPIG